MALMIWLIAGFISACGALVMLELGTSMPRSGGMKVYLEKAFSPRLLVTCVYLFYCVFLRESPQPSSLLCAETDFNTPKRSLQAMQLQHLHIS